MICWWHTWGWYLKQSYWGSAAVGMFSVSGPEVHDNLTKYQRMHLWKAFIERIWLWALGLGVASAETEMLSSCTQIWEQARVFSAWHPQGKVSATALTVHLLRATTCFFCWVEVRWQSGNFAVICFLSAKDSIKMPNQWSTPGWMVEK